MSASTGGVDCTNATPNAEEIAGVEANYAGGRIAAPHKGTIVVDRQLVTTDSSAAKA